MYLSTLKLWNFRKYGIIGDDIDLAEPGLEVNFHKGVNVLIGENDSGKTAIVDAIRYVLKTKSGEYVNLENKDFHECDGVRATSLKIECVFSDISPVDAGIYLEWLGFKPTAEDTMEYQLSVRLSARIVNGRILHTIKAGLGEGAYLEGEAKELLKVVYLKPLRDALADMTHGNKSRFAQILQAHPIFSENVAGDELEEKYNSLKDEVNNYFNQGSGCLGESITLEINELLSNFLTANDVREAAIRVTGNDVTDILRQMDLVLESNKSGLGSLNLLYVAAELLLMKKQEKGVKLTLIEELEAHLHPQYQLRLIDYIKGQSDYGQFILTTHSTTMGSVIPLENLIILKDNNAYPMGHEYTEMLPSDYYYLERFLDATKANLFFANGLIVVEGDAEALLLPQIANVIGLPLNKYGISIVKVGSTAYKRYVKIFSRKDGKVFNMPIAIISDLDVCSIEYYNNKQSPKVFICNQENVDKLREISESVDFSYLPSVISSKKEFETYIDLYRCKVRCKKSDLVNEYTNLLSDITVEAIDEIRRAKKAKCENELNKGNVRVFMPVMWTLEYDWAMSSLFKELEQAKRIAYYEKTNSDKDILGNTFTSVMESVESDFKELQIGSELAYSIFTPLNEGSVSKAATAQYLGQILLNRKTDVKDRLMSDPYLAYLIDAIKYVTLGNHE